MKTECSKDNCLDCQGEHPEKGSYCQVYEELGNDLKEENKKDV